MSSSKQKGHKLKLTRAEKKEELKKGEILARNKKVELEKAALVRDLQKGIIVPVDKSKLISRCAIPKKPDYYRDVWFTCKDCNKQDLWTARQQQRWYEEQGGEIEAIAIRCRACRRKEKLRREAVRKNHLEGLMRKRNAAK